MKIFRPSLAFAALSLSISSACLVIQTVTPAAPGTSAPTAASTQGSSTSATVSPASSPTLAASATGQVRAAGPLSLQVLSPQDGAVVTTNQIQVNGTGAPGEVVSVNDNIQIIGVDGRFDTTVSLAEGPNLIEVVASNDSGEQTNIELTVTYTP